MSDPQLPTELLDHIVDLLHDRGRPLRYCSLVSKSWIPRARKHLFADVRLNTVKRLQLWKGMFPDPSTSPARYTKTLLIAYPHAVIAADAEEGSWIKAFSQVIRLEVGYGTALHPAVSLLPFHGLSPAMKTLRVDVTLPSPPDIFDLILSYPLLEDLAVAAYDSLLIDGDGSDELSTTTQLSIPPMFTGSLELLLRGRAKHLARRLLFLPGGIHFRELDLAWFYEEDLLLATALVEGCFRTLEALNISCRGSLGMSIQHLRLHQSPISVSSRTNVSFYRPLEGDKTQRCGFPHQFVGRWLDHHGTPNHHTQPSGSATNLDPHVFQFHLQGRWWQREASHRRTSY